MSEKKNLKLKCQFELNSFETALSFIDTQKHFIRNSKLLWESPGKKCMNILKFVSGLIKLKINFDEYTLAVLKKQYRATKELIQSDWISEKISEIENRK